MWTLWWNLICLGHVWIYYQIVIILRLCAQTVHTKLACSNQGRSRHHSRVCLEQGLWQEGGSCWRALPAVGHCTCPNNGRVFELLASHCSGAVPEAGQCLGKADWTGREWGDRPLDHQGLHPPPKGAHLTAHQPHPRPSFSSDWRGPVMGSALP